MPHIIVEYSRNLSDAFNVKSLLTELHEILAHEDSVDLKRIKTRAIPLDDCVIGDENQPDEMVHVTLKLMPGRDNETRKRMALNLQAAVQAHIHDMHPKCCITAEVQELDAPSYCG